MKTKPLYIYLIIILVLILGIFFFSSNNKTDKITTDKPIIVKDKMPNDEIHNNINSLDTQKPTKENVNGNVVHKMEMLEKEFTNGSSDTVKMLEFANMLVAGHQIEKGILYYNKILNKDSKRDDILLQLAFIYSNKKDYKKALKVTNGMLKNNPKNKTALYNLGALNATMGKRDLAKSIWEDIVNKFPNTEISEKAKQSLKRL